ncbi:hypothetical protein HI914_05806 [Erysiphe necator]|uniref:Uncharacterized protein n=1 Tax=Uncinula necator TaxID=52586 RepID=A0A0B1PAI3_UNCNE|nr:hypothetical protein HI914_05806 [Erysiphe necator]KHJ33679.1 hypothetical protein EV44_g0297 [Erysiphe necator]
MSWASILPPSVSFIETWAVRLFILLGALTIGPWLLLIMYDAVLYIFRTTFHEFLQIKSTLSTQPHLKPSEISNSHFGEQQDINFNILEKTMDEQAKFNKDMPIFTSRSCKQS